MKVFSLYVMRRVSRSWLSLSPNTNPTCVISTSLSITISAVKVAVVDVCGAASVVIWNGGNFLTITLSTAAGGLSPSLPSFFQKNVR